MMYHQSTNTNDQMKPKGCNPVESSGEIAPQKGVQVNAGNRDVSCATEPLLGTSHTASLTSSDRLSSICSDWSVDMNMESRDNQIDNFILTTHEQHTLRDGENHNLDKSSSVTSYMSLEKSEDQLSNSVRLVKDVNPGIKANPEDNPSSVYPDEETIVPFMFDDPTDADIWVPPSPENEYLLATFDEEEDGDGVEDDDDDECVDGVNWGKSSSLNSLREVMNKGSLFKEQKEQKEKIMEEVMNGKFKNLVSQLLKTVGIVSLKKEGESWVDIVSSLAWKAALFVKLDAAKGNAMDPASYVKVKCVATGSPNESKLVKGLVFKKHAAHKLMATKYTKPRLMLIKGMLGHSSGFSSLNSMIAEDKDNVQKKDNISEDFRTLLGHLETYRPNVVLMEKSAPRHVLEEILKMGVTLVVDMKLHRLERIAQCTGSPIWFANNMQAQKLKQCDSLYFQKFLEEHAQLGEGGKMPHKTLMFLEGSPNGLGCTVLLKGSHIEELKKIKCVVQCAVVMAYHYILETSFLVDQEVMFSTISADGGANKRDWINIPIFGSTHQESIQVDGGESNLCSQSAVVQDVMETLVSSAEQYMKPYLRLSGKYSDTEAASPVSVLPTNDSHALCSTKPNGRSNDEQVTDTDNNSQTLLSSKESICDLRKNGSDSDEHSGKKDDISAVLDSESILVLMSSRNALRGTVCEQSHFSHIKFYRNFDVPLGKFLEDNLLNQSVPCKACDELPEAHYYYYAHHNKQLTIRVKRIPGTPLPGESARKLWMWSRCGKCKPENEDKKNITKLVLISDAARGLSFGKFLELSFSSYSSYNRLSNCGHSLHRDFLYFFGLGSMVSMFRYSPVAKYTVSVPPQKLEFNSPIEGDWLQKETKSVHARSLLLFTEVFEYLKKIETRFSGLTLDINGSIKEYIDIEKMLLVEKFAFEEYMKKTCIKNGDSMRKLLCLNHLRWELFLEACIWNRRFQLLLSSGSASAYTATNSKLAPEKPDVAQYNNKKSEATSPVLDAGQSEVVSDVNVDKVLETCTDVEIQIEPVPGPQKFDISMPIRVNSTLTSTQDIKDSKEPVSHPTENAPIIDLVLTKRKIPILEELGENILNIGRSLSGQAAFQPASNLEVSKGQWVWNSFSEIREECMKDLQNRVHLPSFLDSFKFDRLHSPDELPTVSQIIREEGLRVHVPLCVDDYMVSDYEGEISSVIACALAFIKDVPQVAEKAINDGNTVQSEESVSLPRAISEPYPLWSLSSTSPESDTIHPAPSMSFLQSRFSSFDGVAPLASSLGTVHPEIPLGKGKYSVVCLYANEFRGLRNLCCPSELDYIASLSRCRTWDAKGGKSKASFAKTLDDRFVIKVIKKTEFESFMKFASDYFKYMKQSFESRNQTCLAKILGIYQVTVRQPKTGKETKHDLMVIEHLSFERNLSRQYDLKGALHARYTANAVNPGDVLLDQNFVNDMNLSPLYVGQKAKRLLQRAVWNDTTFLNSINVMDYSLLVGVDLKKKELVCGIIDYVRQYTWDKQLETWVKSSLVVPKNLLPTVISPKEYKKRFRKFMDTHFVTVPDLWCSRRPSNPCKLCGIEGNHTSSH